MAVLALVRFFIGVNSRMYFDFGTGSKTFLTVLALVAFLFSVNIPYMFLQIYTVSKAFLTKLTLKRFLFGVNHCMSFELKIRSEAFLTVCTLIRFLFGMLHFYMVVTTTSYSKTFVAVLALIRFLFVS